MTALNLVISHTGLEYLLSDVDFTDVTPKDIVNAIIEEFDYSNMTCWRFVKESRVLDDQTTLEKLGVKDGDKVFYNF